MPGSPPHDAPAGRLRRPDGPPAGFFDRLLSAQCQCGQARQGAVLLPDGDRGFGVVAWYPRSAEGHEAADWLRQCADAGRKALTARAPTVVPIQGREHTHAILLPLDIQTSARVLEAFLVKTPNKRLLESTRQRLELTVGLVGLVQQHLARGQGQEGLSRLRQAMETLAAVNRHHRLRGVAMALCNELAAQWRCERASIGFLRGRYVQVKAISHTEHFSRKMRLIQDLEAAMEEALDQDTEVVHPADAEATTIGRAAGELSSRNGQEAVVSLPLRHEGEPQAVVTLERPAGEPFTAEEIEAIRLTCDLCAPRLMSLHRYDRWVGARAAAGLRRGVAALVGPEHAWAKLVAVLAFAAILFLTLAKGWYRVRSAFVLEAVSQYKIAAPFDGFIKDVGVEVGDRIVENETALAELDTAELRLQWAAAEAERAGYLKQADAAMRDRQTADAQIAQAYADKARAQAELYAYRIEQARILSPVSGTLVTGDLKRQIGAPVETGQVLFEVAPLGSLRAELHVPEDEIFDIEVGQQGRLATATYPSQRMSFEIERIDPAAEVINNRNVFKVRARLLEKRPWMRPGMEGVAKVTVEKRRYVWIWTRKVINWLRMKLWL